MICSANILCFYGTVGIADGWLFMQFSKIICIAGQLDMQCACTYSFRMCAVGACMIAFVPTVNTKCFFGIIPVSYTHLDNVLTAAIDSGVKKVICLSTDKAAYPVNAMGASKALMEKVFIARARTVSPDRTLICGTRYGNVMCSRGSVIPLFIEQIKAGKPLTVTNPNMTRFMMSLEEAVDLVLFTFAHAQSGDIMVQKAPACTIGILAQALQELFGVKNEIQVIGVRHGEKLYETLLTKEECVNAVDMGNFYRVPMDKRKLNYTRYQMEERQEAPLMLEEFNSNNTVQLTVEMCIRDSFYIFNTIDVYFYGTYVWCSITQFFDR